MATTTTSNTAAPQAVSDEERQKLEAAIAAALLLIYRGRARQALDHMGRVGIAAAVSTAAAKRIAAFARERAQKIQDGTNVRLQAALSELPDDASTDERDHVTRLQQQQASDHNRDVLLPFLASWAIHQAIVDTYREQTDDSGQSMAETRDWVWTRNTAAPADDCQAAADASPAPLSDLLDIAGDVPPAHENCSCTLEPA